MTRDKIIMATIAVVIAASAAASAAYAYKGERLAPEAKITLDQARQIALKAEVGGRPVLRTGRGENLHVERPSRTSR
jgi:hypothetical protein